MRVIVCASSNAERYRSLTPSDRSSPVSGSGRGLTGVGAVSVQPTDTEPSALVTLTLLHVATVVMISTRPVTVSRATPNGSSKSWTVAA